MGRSYRERTSILSHIQLFAMLWTGACQALLSMEFSRQEYCSGLPFRSPGNLPNPGIKPRSPTLQVDSLTSNYEASQMAQRVKDPPANAEDPGSIPESGRFPGERNGNPLQYSCLENSTDRGAWWATVHRITEWDTTEQLSLHTHFQCSHLL